MSEVRDSEKEFPEAPVAVNGWWNHPFLRQLLGVGADLKMPWFGRSVITPRRAREKGSGNVAAQAYSNVLAG